MGIEYKIFVFDDHLGMLWGRTCEQEAERINEAMKEEGANVFTPFKYVPRGWL